MDGTGPVEGEEEVRWKELRRQAWEGLGWKSRSGWEGQRGLGREGCAKRERRTAGDEIYDLGNTCWGCCVLCAGALEWK